MLNLDRIENEFLNPGPDRSLNSLCSITSVWNDVSAISLYIVVERKKDYLENTDS